MRKKLVIGIFLMLVIATITIVPTTLANPENDPLATDLIAGQYIDVGDVEVWDDGTTLYVKYIIDDPWVMSESHVHIGNTLADFPLTKTGNPRVGLFDYQMCHDPPVTEYTYEIPYDGETIIATHAVVWDYSCYDTGIVYGIERSTGKVWGVDVLAGTAWVEFQTVAPPPSTISPNGLGYDETTQRMYYVDYRTGSLPETLYFWDYNTATEYIAGDLPNQIAAADCYNGKYYYIASYPATDDLYEVTFDTSGYIATITKLADIANNAHAWTFDGDIAVKDDIVYGWGHCTHGYEFFTYDLNTYAFNVLVTTYQYSLQLAFGSNGELYGHRSGGNGSFYEIDTTNGEVTYISAPWVQFTDCASGMICEPYDETAWGNGENFPGNQWAMYFFYGQINNNKPVTRELSLIEIIFMKIMKIIERILALR
jgi:hypothetical protein